MTKQGSSCSKLHLVAPEDDEEDVNKTSASLAAALKIGVDAVVVVVLSRPDGKHLTFVHTKFIQR